MGLSWSFLLKVCDSVLNSLLLVAQAEAAKPELEVTTGQQLAGIVGILVFVASFIVVIRCVLRWKNGHTLIPVAQRKPLHVHTAVAVVGVIIAVLLASGAVIASLDETLLVDANLQQAEDELVLDTDPADPSDGDIANDQITEDQPTVGQPTVGQFAVDQVVEDQLGDDLAAEPVIEELADAADAVNHPDPDSLAWDMIAGILTMNGVLLFLFGSLVWLTQADGPGRSVLVDQQTLTAPADAATSTEQIRSLDTSFAAFVDDSRPSTFSQSDADQSDPSMDSTETQSIAVYERWNFFVELKFAGLAFLMALVPTIATRLLVVSLMPEPKSHPFIEMMQGGGLAVQVLMLLMLIATISAPIVEELLYRVVVLGGLLNYRSKWVAIGVSAVLFSFAHGFPDCISLLPLAMILGYTYVQRRSYRTVMLVHFIFNAFNMCLALLQMVD